MVRPSSAAAALVILLVAGCAPSPPTPSQPPPTPESSATASASPTPTAPAASTAPAAPTSPAAAWDDTSDWTPYATPRTGLRVLHPPDWSVVPAERDWTMAQDAGIVDSPGQDSFVSPDGLLWVSVWVAPYAGSETLESIGIWAYDLCVATGTADCRRIVDLAEPLCHGAACGPALLLTFEHDVQAFFTPGEGRGGLAGVASWRAADYPVHGSGTSREILDAFLAGMDVRPQP